MAATLNRVKCGDPLIVSASTFNTFIDAARAHKQQRHGTRRSPQQDQRQTGIVLVHNASGADRDRFNVLGIAGPAIAPVDNPEEFASRVAVSGVTPAEAHAGRFVVLFGPVADGAIGRAYVDGVCPALVKMADEDHGFADVEAGQAGRLLSAAAGSAAILWVEPVEDRDNPEIARAVVRIGSPSSDEGFLGKIQTAGPNEEADYEDARYWVQEVVNTTQDETGPWIMAVVPVESGGRWVTATNLVELGIGAFENGPGKHCIVREVEGIDVPPRYVWVKTMWSGAARRYYFDSYPGQMQGGILPHKYAYAQTTCLEDGCPNGDWYIMAGPGFLAKVAPDAC